MIRVVKSARLIDEAIEQTRRWLAEGKSVSAWVMMSDHEYFLGRTGAHPELYVLNPRSNENSGVGTNCVVVAGDFQSMFSDADFRKKVLPACCVANVETFFVTAIETGRSRRLRRMFWTGDSDDEEAPLSIEI